MKNVWIMILLMPLVSFANDREIHLDKRKYLLENVKQEEGEGVFERITLVRDVNSPKKIDMGFFYKFRRLECTQWEERRIWIPPRYERVCHATGPDGRVVCYDRMIPGFWETVKDCVKREYFTRKASTKFRLDFTDANKLKGDQIETFELILNQEDFESKSIDISAVPDETLTDYEIKFRTWFVEDGLYFKAK